MNINEYNIMHLLNKLKEQSECIDKQVVCVITDEYQRIISTGINEVVFCDKNCHDKENRKCFTVHAEIIAMANLRNFSKRAKYAYLNLFPCAPCQQALSTIVEEIVVFGPKHKEQVFDNIRLERNLYADLLNSNKQAKQLSVAQGELCELVTAISDYFYRPEKKMKVQDIADEIIDAELMLDQIKLICWNKEPELYNVLKYSRESKYKKIQKRLNNESDK